MTDERIEPGQAVSRPPAGKARAI